jgi:predicted GH43/DUF377 family glycosyl hydrolase
MIVKVRQLFSKGVYFSSAILLVGGVFLYKDVRSMRKKIHHVARKMPALNTQVDPHYVRVNLPSCFQKVHFADEVGIILSSKVVKINGVAHPYNPSIVEKLDGEGYYFFFRYDVKKSDVELHSAYPLETYIGVAELDRYFQHIDHSYRVIDTGTCTAEDPRAFYVGTQLYLSFNDLVPVKQYSRSIRMAQVDPKTWTLRFATDFNMQQQPIEKNWMPFSYQDSMHFIYNVSPHKIFHIPNPEENVVLPSALPELPTLLHQQWESKYGKISGGSPARRVNGEYLAFFHSRKREGSLNWYGMGAYTFESKPPFRITSITTKPILFHGIYSSNHVHTSNPFVKCIFPAGFVFEKQGSEELIHVSVGENDVSSKILTFNKEKLFESMEKVDAPKEVRGHIVGYEPQ